MWCLWGSVMATKRCCLFDLIDRLDWAMAVWIYGCYTHEWGSLTNFEKTVKFDANLRCVVCEALCLLSKGVVCSFLSNVWTELWLFEYMGNIHMSGVASLTLKKLWDVTYILDVIFVRLCDSCQTPLSVFSMDRLDWAMAVWIYGQYTHEWGSLTNC